MPIVLDVTERSIVPLGRGIIDRVVGPTSVVLSVAVGTATTVTSAVPSSVPGSATVGSPNVFAAITVEPGSIAGSANTGSPSVGVTVNPASVVLTTGVGTVTLLNVIRAVAVASSLSVGTAKTTSKIAVAGVAATGSPGTPNLVMVLRPVTVAGATTVGSPASFTIMTPAGLRVRNLFGDAVATKRGWVFRPPVNTYQVRVLPFKEYEGVSLLKENGTWSEVAHPDLDRTLNAERFLGGGRDHVVSTSLKTELEGLGYTVSQQVVTTEEYL